jgi:hypothetical protein
MLSCPFRKATPLYSYMPLKADSTVNITLRLSKEERAKFRIYAIQHDTTMQDLLQDFVRSKLKNSRENR